MLMQASCAFGYSPVTWSLAAMVLDTTLGALGGQLKQVGRKEGGPPIDCIGLAYEVPYLFHFDYNYVGAWRINGQLSIGTCQYLIAILSYLHASTSSTKHSWCYPICIIARSNGEADSHLLQGSPLVELAAVASLLAASKTHEVQIYGIPDLQAMGWWGVVPSDVILRMELEVRAACDAWEMGKQGPFPFPAASPATGLQGERLAPVPADPCLHAGAPPAGLWDRAGRPQGEAGGPPGRTPGPGHRSSRQALPSAPLAFLLKHPSSCSLSLLASRGVLCRPPTLLGRSRLSGCGPTRDQGQGAACGCGPAVGQGPYGRGELPPPLSPFPRRRPLEQPPLPTPMQAKALLRTLGWDSCQCAVECEPEQEPRSKRARIGSGSVGAGSSLDSCQSLVDLPAQDSPLADQDPDGPPSVRSYPPQPLRL